MNEQAKLQKICDGLTAKVSFTVNLNKTFEAMQANIKQSHLKIM